MTQANRAVSQQLYAITLGASDVVAQREFYQAWGWQPLPYGGDEYAGFQLEGAIVAFWDMQKLGEEAGATSAAGDWKGVTLAIKVGSRDDVDATWRSAIAAGAHPVGEPEDRFWGGRSGYVSDPEGNRWEIVWMPEQES